MQEPATEIMGQDRGMQQPRDFSLYGAVDLGARQAATQRRQQAARTTAASAPGNGEASAFVIDVTEETFNTEVAARSRTTPVIVDLWADWCGPCKQLSPVLEKLANEAAGTWVLAKIDVDANPRLAQAFQAQSIPMVVAIIGGQMVDAFLGAMPEAQVKQWLTQVLAVGAQLGVSSAGGSGGAAGMDAGSPDEAESMPPAYAEVQAAMERGDMDAAASVLEKTLAENPADPVLKSWLAQVNLIRRVDSYDEATARRAAAASPGDVDAQVKVADIEMAAGRTEDAFQRLLGAVKRTTGEERNKARLALLDLFDIFPPDDPQVKKARGQLTALLF
jgi:putative thioredoxin